MSQERSEQQDNYEEDVATVIGLVAAIIFGVIAGLGLMAWTGVL